MVLFPKGLQCRVRACIRIKIPYIQICLVPGFGGVAGDVPEAGPAALLHIPAECLRLSALAPSSSQLLPPPSPAFLTGFYGMGRTLQPPAAMISLPILRCVTVQLASSYVCLRASSPSLQNPEPSFFLGGVPALRFPFP